MNQNLRPSLYEAHHPLYHVPSDASLAHKAGSGQFFAVGPLCESGDLLTPDGPRAFHNPQIGDYIVIGGAGAYCESMAADNYNALLRPGSFIVDEQGDLFRIRAEQTLEELLSAERLVKV